MRRVLKIVVSMYSMVTGVQHASAGVVGSIQIHGSIQLSHEQPKETISS